MKFGVGGFAGFNSTRVTIEHGMRSTLQISPTASDSVLSPNRIRHQYIRAGQKLMRIRVDVARRVLSGSARSKARHTQNQYNATNVD
jgi:hypothetical protein